MHILLLLRGFILLTMGFLLFKAHQPILSILVYLLGGYFFLKALLGKFE
jgi:hypothetical protein